MGSRFFGGILTARLLGLLTVLIIVSFLFLPTMAYAEEITYAGDGKKLQESPAWFFKSLNGLLFPGTTGAPLSLNNKVIINYNPGASGTEDLVFVCGGFSKTETVGGNSVTLLSGYVDMGMFGGYSENGSTTDNIIIISGGFISGAVSGGWSYKGNVTGNMVTTNGGIVREDVYGGFSHKGSVTGNSVTIKEGEMGSAYGGRSGDGGATGNSVTISGGSIRSKVYGGWSRDGGATGNSVTISGGSVVEDVYGGLSGDGGAIGNSVTISGGSVAEDVYGGWGDGDGGAIGNSVTISGGSIRSKVYGGWSENKDATDNIITISGRPDMADAYIFGGYCVNASGDAFTGNTLNIKRQDISVTLAGNFEYYNFYLPENPPAADMVMLTVKETVDLAKTTVEIFLQDGAKLKKGDKIALIHSAEVISGAPKNKSCKAQQGGALYEFSIYTDSNNLWAQVTKISNAAK